MAGAPRAVLWGFRHRYTLPWGGIPDPLLAVRHNFRVAGAGDYWNYYNNRDLRLKIPLISKFQLPTPDW